MLERIAAAKDLLGSYFWDNPIFLKELRLHFRTPRTFWVQGLYICLLGAALSAFTFFVQIASPAGGRAMQWTIGQMIFRALYSAHVLLVIVLLSSLASGAITGEKDARTYELIDSLPLSKGRFVAGKFAALVLLTGLFMVSGVPILIVTLQSIGGVATADIAGAAMTLCGFTALVAAMGVLASAVSENYRASVFLCYRIIIFALVVSWALRIYAFYSAALGSYGMAAAYGPIYALNGLFSNPVVRSMPMLGIAVWPLSLLVLILPVPGTLDGAFWLFAVCAGLAVPILTGAADALRPADEKRTYQLVLQAVVFFHLLLAGFLMSGSRAWTASPATAGAAVFRPVMRSGAASPARPGGASPSGLDYVLLEATALFLLSVLALPIKPKQAGTWRGVFSGGPLAGGFLLAACAVSGYLLWALLSPEVFGGTAPPGAPAAAFLALRSGTVILLGLIPSWMALGELSVALSEKHSRQIFVAGQLLISAGPILVNALLPPGLRGAISVLFSLNPWISLSTLDPSYGEGLQRLLGLPAAPSVWGLSIASLLLAGGLWLAATAVKASRKTP